MKLPSSLHHLKSAQQTCRLCLSSAKTLSRACPCQQNKLDEESLARLKAKAAADKAAGVTRVPETGAEEAIPGGVDVTSSITANVWEVHVKVRGEKR